MQPTDGSADERGVKRKTAKVRKTLSEWSWMILILWILQVGVLIYFLVTQTWSTYWFCRDLYKPGLALFAMAGRGFLPGEWFNLFSKTGVLVSFMAAALIYSALAVVGFHAVRYVSRP